MSYCQYCSLLTKDYKAPNVAVVAAEADQAVATAATDHWMALAKEPCRTSFAVASGAVDAVSCSEWVCGAVGAQVQVQMLLEDQYQESEALFLAGQTLDRYLVVHPP